MNFELIDIVGAIGGGLLLFGFWRTNSGHWKASSPWYELDNVLGSGLLLAYTWNKQAYISSILNVIWCYVALRGLSSFAERQMAHNKNFKKGYRKGRRRLHR